jgi:hypothetical protein
MSGHYYPYATVDTSATLPQKQRHNITVRVLTSSRRDEVGKGAER